MLITLISNDFVFNRAHVMLVRRDNPERGDSQGECHENEISGLVLQEVGNYNLWFSQIELRPLSGLGSFHVNGHVIPWPIEFTKEDLDRGAKSIAMPAGGVFRITVIDASRVPIPRYKLLASQGETTVEIHTDANGSQVMYGNPTQCYINIDEGTGIIIERLHIPL
jgi:hypothetical protein